MTNQKSGSGTAVSTAACLPCAIPAFCRGNYYTGKLLTERDFSGETCEAAAFDDACAGQAEVFVDHDDLLRGPAQRGGLGYQSILSLRRFAIVLDLCGGGLSKIDVSSAAQMRGADLCGVIHWLSPSDLSPGRLAR